MSESRPRPVISTRRFWLAVLGTGFLGAGNAQALLIVPSYNANVPAPAQAVFTSIARSYSLFNYTNATVNVSVNFGATGLASSTTNVVALTYTNWRADMAADSTANPQNAYLSTGLATQPAADPLNGTQVLMTTANARAIGVTNAQVVASSAGLTPATDSTLTFSNAASTFSYTGVATVGLYDFATVAEHELNEALGIISALTGIANNGAIPADRYAPEDFYRYDGNGNRSTTTNPNATAYFTYNRDAAGTDVSGFNQDNNAGGNVTADRNDWIYGNFGCPAATVEVQNAVGCRGQVGPLMNIGSPEFIVLSTLGYDIPEPAMLSVFGAALAGLVARRRRSH
jgi:PEP-CTERM motif